MTPLTRRQMLSTSVAAVAVAMTQRPLAAFGFNTTEGKVEWLRFVTEENAQPSVRRLGP